MIWFDSKIRLTNMCIILTGEDTIFTHLVTPVSDPCRNVILGNGNADTQRVWVSQSVHPSCICSVQLESGQIDTYR
jgi:hypothetical protein